MNPVAPETAVALRPLRRAGNERIMLRLEDDTRTPDHGPVRDSFVPAELEVAHQRSARAAQRITALGEMTAGLAHDFRNILTVIESGLNLVERDLDDRAKVEAALAAAREGVRRGIRQTSQLVAFARPEKPDVHLENINDLLGALKTFLKYGAGPGIRVVLDLAPDLPTCSIDPPRFNAAILNLIVNARDAMPEGGEIRVETAVCRQPRGAPGRCIRVRVIDHGCGMPPEVVQHLFDPYFTTKGEAGTGLGVPQVAAFMRSSGGTVSVSTEPGMGTTFDLLFPLPERREPADGTLWRQVDRWENEGGRPDPTEPPVVGQDDAVSATGDPRMPAAHLPGTNPDRRDQ